MQLIPLLSASLLALASPSLAKETRYLFTFGDSYSRTGFYYTKTHPTAAHPLGNPDFPGETSSGGINWIGSLVSEHNQDVTYLSYNVARSGAVVNKDIVAPDPSNTVNLGTQVAAFRDSASSKPDWVPWSDKSGAAGFWFGINDIRLSFTKSDATEIHHKVIDKYIDTYVQQLYDAGIRKFFFVTVPPLELTPLFKGKAQTPEKAIIAYNARLRQKLEEWHGKYPSAKYIVIDSAPDLRDAVKNGKDCQNTDGTSCVWYNDLHPGVDFHKRFATTVSKALPALW